MTTSDAELIDSCLRGQPDAFGVLVRRYQDRLYHSLFRILGSAEDAQDIAQEAFVQAFQKLDTFRGDAKFYSWLFRIAYNAAISMKRKSRLKTVSVEGVRENSGREPQDQHPETAPSHALELTEQQTLVQRALAELPDEYRVPLILKEIDEQSYEEIAELLEIPIGTVRSRLHRARSELREKLRILLKQMEEPGGG